MQRRDARTNRARILEVADEVFGRGGESASTEEVARLAGVGIATVFRHFPTKAALLEAVLVERFARLRARAVAELAAADPGAAFYGFFTFMVEDAASKIAIADAYLADDGAAPDGGAISAAAAELRQAFGRLLARAQEAHAVRADVDLPEVYAVLIGASRASTRSALDPAVRTKALGIIFDGLAAPA
jgi:AcrR family transcriptional regulator